MADEPDVNDVQDDVNDVEDAANDTPDTNGQNDSQGNDEPTNNGDSTDSGDSSGDNEDGGSDSEGEGGEDKGKDGKGEDTPGKGNAGGSRAPIQTGPADLSGEGDGNADAEAAKQVANQVKEQVKEKAKQAAKKAAKKAAEKAGKEAVKGGLKALLPILPYVLIAIAIILLIMLVIGVIMSFTMLPSMLLGKIKKFIVSTWANVTGWFTGDSIAGAITDEDIADLANYIQNMGYDIQGYGFGDVEYKEHEDDESIPEEDGLVDTDGNAIDRDEIVNTKSQDVKKIYGINKDEYAADQNNYMSVAGFSSKNSNYLLAYMAAGSATYAEAHWSVAGFFTGLAGEVDDTFRLTDSEVFSDPGKTGTKSYSTGLLNINNESGNSIFNTTIDGSNINIKVDADNQKLNIYEKALSLGITQIQWGKTFSVDLSNWTAIYGRPMELFLALHLSTMMPDLPYQIAVDQMFNTKVNVNLADVNVNFDTTIELNGHNVTFGERNNLLDQPNTAAKEDNLDVLVNQFLNYQVSQNSDGFWSGIMDYVNNTLPSIIGADNAKIYRRCMFEAIQDQLESIAGNIDNWLFSNPNAVKINYRSVMLKADQYYMNRGFNSINVKNGIVQVLLDMLKEAFNAAFSIGNILSDITGFVTEVVTTVIRGVGLFFGWLDGLLPDITITVEGRVLKAICDVLLPEYDPNNPQLLSYESDSSAVDDREDGIDTNDDGEVNGDDDQNDDGTINSQQKNEDDEPVPYDYNPSTEKYFRTGDDTNNDGIVSLADSGQSQFSDSGSAKIHIDILGTIASTIRDIADDFEDLFYIQIDVTNTQKTLGPLVSDDGTTFNATLTSAQIQNFSRLVAAGLGETKIKLPYIGSVTNHWYYDDIDFLGNSLDYNDPSEAPPYGVYKKAGKAKKILNYSDDSGTLDEFKIQLNAVFSSNNGVFYQVCEPYLNEQPSKYIKRVFAQKYYRYDGTVETARKIVIAKKLDDITHRDPTIDILDASVRAQNNNKYKWHNEDTVITQEEAEEYLEAKKIENDLDTNNEATTKDDGTVIRDDANIIANSSKMPEYINLEEETVGIDENDPMVRKYVNFTDNKQNALSAFAILENVNSEEADTNYRLLKKLMVSMNYFTKNEMDEHETNILLWITNTTKTVDGVTTDVSGESIAQSIANTGGDVSQVAGGVNGNVGRDVNKYGINVTDFMLGTYLVAPGDADITEISGDKIELEFTSMSQNKLYPLKDQLMFMHQDDTSSPFYNKETEYGEDPLYSAVDVLRKYRFKDTYQVFSEDDIVGLKMTIEGAPLDSSLKVGDHVTRGQTLSADDLATNAVINVQMKKADKSRVENVEDYIVSSYTYADEKKMAAELWYENHKEYGNKYNKRGRMAGTTSGSGLIQGSNNAETIWFTLIGIYGLSKSGAAGVMGNWYQESGYLPNNLENPSNEKSGLSDEEFTAKVDNKSITREQFIASDEWGLWNCAGGTGPYYGYGLGQWTAPEWKSGLYDLCASKGASVADMACQIEFFIKNARDIGILDRLKQETTPEEQCAVVYWLFERGCSSIQGETPSARVNEAVRVYNEYKDKSIPVNTAEGMHADYIDGPAASYVNWMIDIADDPSHGYCQAHHGMPDVDCSSFVSFAVINNIDSSMPNSYTGILKDSLINTGKFNCYTVDQIGGYGALQPGDILLIEHRHTEVVVNQGTTIGAHGPDNSPGGHVSHYNGPNNTNPRYAIQGDQTGSEVSPQGSGGFTWWQEKAASDGRPVYVFRLK